MILVTGSTGKVGSEVIRQLAERGIHPRALVRSEHKRDIVSAMGADVVIGDLENPDTLNAAMEGVDHLFLLSPSSPEQTRLEANAVDAAKRAGVGHIVKLSVIGASPTSDINLVRWHWQSEKYIEESGIGYTHIRPTIFMQIFLEMSEKIMSESRIYAPAGDGKASLIDVRDIASVVVVTLVEEGHMGKQYDITGPEALSYNDVAEKLSAVIGQRIDYVDIPRDAARQAMQDMKLPDWWVNDYLKYLDYVRSGDLSRVTHRCIRLIGKQPHTFDDFACDYVSAFKREYKAA